MKSEAQLKARKKYMEKCKILRITLYPTDQDIIDRIGDNEYSPYIKELIRQDIKNRQ